MILTRLKSQIYLHIQGWIKVIAEGYKVRLVKDEPNKSTTVSQNYLDITLFIGLSSII